MNLVLYLGVAGIIALSAVGAFLVVGVNAEGRMRTGPALAVLAGGLCIAIVFALALSSSAAPGVLPF